MTLPIDIHTHHLPQAAGTAIISIAPGEFRPAPGEWYSLGIHPWHIPTTLPDRGIGQLLNHAAHPQVLAIGEAGLDKLTETPLSVQAAVFQQQAQLAEEVGKPLIIHLVKATNELLQLKRRMQPRTPWIIHGFRGKSALAETYLRHGFHLSFGEKYQPEALRAVPLDHLFIETDESTVAVEALYQKAATVLSIPVWQLKEAVQHNINRVFFSL